MKNMAMKNMFQSLIGLKINWNVAAGYKTLKSAILGFNP